MAAFVSLSCPSCGGKLQITPDIQRFACAHCGREQIVQRGEGTISLSPVVDAIHKVQVGVNQTAAELAIVRLQKELPEIQAQRSQLAINSPRPGVGIFPVLIVIGGILFLAGLIRWYISAVSEWSPTIPFTNAITAIIIMIFCSLFPIGIIVIGLVPFFRRSGNIKRWESTTGAQLKGLDELISEKNAELHHYLGAVKLNPPKT
jgi:uncharacterized membrane protein YidH (DUF202 family)